jgi:hypothetical protein
MIQSLYGTYFLFHSTKCQIDIVLHSLWVCSMHLDMLFLNHVNLFGERFLFSICELLILVLQGSTLFGNKFQEVVPLPSFAIYLYQQK